MDPKTGQPMPSAPPPYGWNNSNAPINQPGGQYQPYPDQSLAPGPQQPLLAGCPPPAPPPQHHHRQYRGGPADQQPLLHGQGPQQQQQYGYQNNYQGYQTCPQYPATGYQPYPGHGQPKPSVVIVGGCPACRVGVLEDDFTCFGVFCAIFCFPLGILCCLAMRQRRCPNCGANFS